MGGAFAPYGAAMRPQPARSAYTSSHLNFVASQPHAHGYKNRTDTDGAAAGIRPPTAQGKARNVDCGRFYQLFWCSWRPLLVKQLFQVQQLQKLG